MSRLALSNGVVMLQNGDFYPINIEARRTMDRHSENTDIEVELIDLANNLGQEMGRDPAAEIVVFGSRHCAPYKLGNDI
jgi:hypothetical protein